jgi:hypothetical protein
MVACLLIVQSHAQLLASIAWRDNMARWMLKDAHYLSVPGIEWEYKESDRETGRAARKVYEVPLYLNPTWTQDWNDPDGIVVSNRFDPAHRRDVVFTGPPTPDMEPLDDEATEISNKYRSEWKHPIESLNMTYSESRLSDFERAIAELLADKGVQKMEKIPNISANGVDPKKFAELQEKVKDLMDMNAILQVELLEKKKADSLKTRRI